MSSKIMGLCAVAIGAAIGSVVTWQYVKKKYEQISQNEIDSVKETFARRATDDACEAKLSQCTAGNKPNIVEYASKLRENGYTNYGDPPVVEEKATTSNKPFVIAPEDFGEFDEYEKISLTFYADECVLTDDDGQVMANVEDIIGDEALNSFGEYENDSVFVRNDQLRCDYEILLDHRKYFDAVERKPHEVND